MESKSVCTIPLNTCMLVPQLKWKSVDGIKAILAQSDFRILNREWLGLVTHLINGLRLVPPLGKLLKECMGLCRNTLYSRDIIN